MSKYQQHPIVEVYPRAVPLLIIAAIFCYVASFICAAKAVLQFGMMVRTESALALGMGETMATLYVAGFATCFGVGSLCVSRSL